MSQKDAKEEFKAGLDLGLFRTLHDTQLWFSTTYKDQITPQQVQWFFSIFDQDRDKMLNQTELLSLIEHWIRPLTVTKSALVVVDYQNDFISGSLSIDNLGSAGHKCLDALRPINRLIESDAFDLIVYTIDWHPENHISFVDNLELRPHKRDGVVKPFMTVEFEKPKLKQIMWPRHCVQGSWGAQLHEELIVAKGSRKVYKGTNPQVDSYSAFYDNDKKTCTELEQVLRDNGITDVFVCGLAYDVCVAYTAEDSLDLGFKTAVLEDCSKGLDQKNMGAAREKLEKAGAVFVDSAGVNRLLSVSDVPLAWAQFVAERFEKSRKK